MKLKKLMALMMASTLVLGFAACGSDDKETDKKDANQQEETNDEKKEEEKNSGSADEGTIVITGSTSVESILEELQTEFQALNPGITIEYTGSGSSSGMSDTQSGTNNIGALSREVKDEEDDGDLQQIVFSYDGIAVIVNPANEAMEDLTMEQLRQIYNGEITDWSEVGGDAGEIQVIAREEASGTRSAFEELIKFDSDEGDQLPNNAMIVEGNGNVQASVESNASAIGYVSFANVNDDVKALKVEGVEPTAENAKDGSYSLSRPFIFVYYEEHVTDAGKAFLDFILTDEGQDIVEKKGGISVK